MSAPTRRINRGSGHGYELDGKAVIAVTKALREGYPKPALVDAAAKVGGKYVVDHWDELLQMEPSGRGETVHKAYAKAWYGAAVRGTTVHEFAQRLQAGERVEVPDEYVGHVDAYLKFVDDWQPRELLVEAPVFSRAFQYAGTTDLVADLADGARWLLDFKTSKGEPWPETALQLAAYRYSDFYLVNGDTTEHPMPKVDRCGVVWLRADGYDLIPMRADHDAFATFGHVQAVAAFRDTPRDHWVGEILQPPMQGEAA